MATLQDIARRANVSVATVSRALNQSGYVRPEVRERVLQIARELSYVPNHLARGLARRRTDLVLLLVPDVTNPFFAAVARGVEDVLAGHGLQLVVGNTDDNHYKERTYLQRALGRGVDGVIAVAASSDSPDTAHFRQLQVPLVLVDRACEEVEADLVVANNESGAYHATRHLLSLGHQRVATITGPLRLKTARDRLAGFQRAVREWRLAGDQVAVVEGDFREDGGYRAARKLLDGPVRPSAVFAANDLMALGAMAAFEEVGVAVPSGIAVAGYDDIPYAVRVRPKLTTVAQPKYEMGAAAAELLLRRLADPLLPPQRVWLEPRLVVRESSVVRSITGQVVPPPEIPAPGPVGAPDGEPRGRGRQVP
ncbi:MAG: LacI family DNA-binding transcriptional regulator [Limnochordaceae bacterium]|nr:LacI family DNA-binding transcriptional regulator [Limnochordaceae bacterium]